MTKKITLATVKKFIRDNAGSLYIATKSRFDGMTDGCEPCADQSFTLAQAPEAGRNHENTLGIQGAWFVFGSRDSFDAFEADGYKGIKVYNCCGSFRLAVRA
jgi:hypothetical protein